MRSLTFFSFLLLAPIVSTGCGPALPGKVAFVGQSGMLQSGCQVTFRDAWAHRGEIRIKLWVANMTQALMMVNRDGFALRTADGRMLPRVGAVHNVYTLPPGGGHEVDLGFRDPGFDMRTYQNVSLIVGGISFSTDPRERVVGEIPLVPGGPHY
jgi:hypothetical protein